MAILTMAILTMAILTRSSSTASACGRPPPRSSLCCGSNRRYIATVSVAIVSVSKYGDAAGATGGPRRRHGTPTLTLTLTQILSLAPTPTLALTLALTLTLTLTLALAPTPTPTRSSARSWKRATLLQRYLVITPTRSSARSWRRTVSVRRRRPPRQASACRQAGPDMP